MSPSLLFFQPITIVVWNRCGSARTNDAGVDLVLIQPFLLYYVNHVVVMLIIVFSAKFHKKEGVLFQNKVNLSLTFTQRSGY